MLVESLDTFRASLLRKTLSVRVLRKVFVDRASRLFIFTVFSFSLYFVFAMSAPLLVIALGPLIFGIPHLFSGFRYLGKNISERSSRKLPWTPIIAGLVFIVGVARSFTFTNRNWIFQNDFELVVFLFVLVLSAFLATSQVFSKGTIFSFLLALSVVAGMLIHPFLTLGILSFGHNAVSFFYWWKVAQTKKEMRVVILGFVFLVLGTYSIFTMPEAWLSKWAIASPFPQMFELDLIETARTLIPSDFNLTLAWRIVCAYAFGQSVHYFVWLKAIPEQSTSQKVPSSFRQSLKSCLQELGPGLTTLGIVMSVCLMVSIPFFQASILRGLYLGIASAHGYIEIALIPFLMTSSAAREFS